MHDDVKPMTSAETLRAMLAGEVQGATVLLVDDMISTGGTMLRAAQTCLAAGASRVYAFAAHGLFDAGASEVITHPAFAATIVTDTVPPWRLTAAARQRVEIVSAAPLFAQAIRRLHEGARGGGSPGAAG